MEWLYLAGNVLVTCFDLFICISFFGIFWKGKEQKKRIRIILCALFFCGTMIPPVSKLWYYLIPAALVYVISFYYKTTARNHLIFSAILVGLLVGCDALSGVLLMLVQSKNMDTIQGSLVSYISGLLLTKCLSLFAVRMTGMFWRKAKKKFWAVQELPLVLLPASSTLILYVITALARNLKEGNLYVYVLFSLLALVSANIYIIHLIERMAELQEEAGRYVLIQRIQQDQRLLYQQFLRSHAEFREMLHDHQNRMLSLMGLLEAGQVNEAMTQIGMDIEWSMGIRMVVTGLDSLDAVVNSKSSVMKKKSIPFSHTILLPSCIGIDHIELGIIVGDLLDNAIEACERIDDVKNRFIMCQIIQSGYYLVIHMENPLPPNEGKRKDFNTSKKEVGHGYGLTSIKKRAEKFHGTATFQRVDKKFIANILLENKTLNPESANFADKPTKFAIR